MDFKWVKYEVADGILTLTMNRPEKMNAQNVDTLLELARAFDAADNDDRVRVVILTGEGKAFCAGADLTDPGTSENYLLERVQGREDNKPHREEGGLVTLRIYDMKKPVIAAINGAAVGIGITMTLPADIRIASKTARMGFVFTRRGIVFDGCASWFLPRAVGISTAAEWVYSGKIFPAQEACDRKLVSELLEPEESHAEGAPDSRRDSAKHLVDIGRPVPAIDVEDAGRGPSHGGAHHRIEVTELDLWHAGRAGRHRIVPR